VLATSKENQVNRWFGRWVIVAALAITVGGCATQRIDARRDLSVGPALSVESFMQAANQRDLEQMARLFGTASGPISDTGGSFGCAFKRMGSWLAMSDRCMTRQDVELRMNAIAMILQHDDYTLGPDRRVAGRESVTTQIGVTITRSGRNMGPVPFVVVNSGSGWLIEQIALDEVRGQ